MAGEANMDDLQNKLKSQLENNPDDNGGLN